MITGGTSGIGRAVVERFIGEGARVVFCGRNREAGAAIAAAMPGQAFFVEADVTRNDDVERLVETAIGAMGAIDCLFNNAATLETSSFLETRREDLEASMWSVFGSVVSVTQHVARAMTNAGGGCIIQCGSSAAHRANSSPAIYSALKAAVCHLTRCLALELAPYGIRVNTLSPGGIITPMLRSLLNANGGNEEEAVARSREAVGIGVPLGRAGEVSDIAAAAVFMASDDASFITGHDMVVDGGITAGLHHGPKQIAAAAMRAILAGA